MNGVAAIRQLLANDGPVTALVPDDRISAGVLPLNIELPAIAITSVSSVDRNILQPGANRRVTERVQVTGYGANYPQMKVLMQAVKRAAADQMPTVDGITDVVVHTDSAGPDLTDEEAKLYLGTQDFRVSFNEAR